MAGWCAERSTIFLFRYFLSVTDRSKDLLVGQLEIQLRNDKTSQRHWFQAGVATGLQLERLAPLVMLQGFRSEPGSRVLLRFSESQAPVRIVDHSVEGCAPIEHGHDVANIAPAVLDRARGQERFNGERLNRISEFATVRGALAACFLVITEQSRTMLFLDLIKMRHQPRTARNIVETVVGGHQPNTLSTTARRSSTFECI